MQTSPLVSVVMPVYNGGEFLVDAVASIAEQSFQDWELVCVNDGSTDGSRQRLDALAKLEPRIRNIHQSNAGIVSALNRGCAAARGKLICRLDCDDIAFQSRLETQVDFMVSHPECVVVGGGILEIDARNTPLAVTKLPKTHDQILHNLLHRRTGHFHPSTMYRRDAFEAAGRYRQSFEWIEDHDLWLRMAVHGQLANIDELLICYRQHASSVCWQRSSQQRELMNSLLLQEYTNRKLGKPPAELVNTSKTRATAGPGKWARVAARGGFPGSAIRLLRELWSTDRTLGYRVRMTAEVLARISVSLPRALSRPAIHVPAFALWHDRLIQTMDESAREAA